MSAITDAFQLATSVSPASIAATILTILVGFSVVLLAWVILKLGQQAIEDPSQQKDVLAYGLRATVLVAFILAVFVGTR